METKITATLVCRGRAITEPATYSGGTLAAQLSKLAKDLELGIEALPILLQPTDVTVHIEVTFLSNDRP